MKRTQVPYFCFRFNRTRKESQGGMSRDVSEALQAFLTSRISGIPLPHPNSLLRSSSSFLVLPSSD